MQVNDIYAVKEIGRERTVVLSTHNLAEVQVTGTPPAPPIVDTLPPNQVTGVTATQNGTAVDVAWAATTDLPDPGGVGGMRRHRHSLSLWVADWHND